MKIYTMILALLIVSNPLMFGQTKKRFVETKFFNINNVKDIEKLNLDFCDTFSVEISGLYETLNTLPNLQNDSTILKTLLIKKGFFIEDWGSGNWEKGPRCIYFKFRKGSCTCMTFKKYFYNKKVNDNSFDLRVTERIICNSDKFMDE